MTKKNLSESLFKPWFKHRETSTLVKFIRPQSVTASDSMLGGERREHWYRMINWLAWIWRGIDSLEIQDILSRIAVTDAERSTDHLLDTVIGYRKGNWAFEWSQLAMQWQQEALRAEEAEQAGACWLKASTLYSIAAYPHLRGDELADQAIVLANKAYENAARFFDYELKKLEFQLEDGKSVTGLLHIPSRVKEPCPTILVCASLDNVQSDCWRLFREHFSPLGFAMLTLDMPAVGYSAKFTLTQDTCVLHQQVLQQLNSVPWIDHTRIGVFGFRFGANIAVRLAYLEPKLIKGISVVGPIVHELLHDEKRQQKIPSMYIDVLASRLGIYHIDENRLRSELGYYSLKNQGLLGRRCSVPMLSVYWEDDIFSPRKDSKLIAMSSIDGSLKAIPATSIYGGFNKALHEISVWLKDKVL
ncbi:putative hydrolase with alpha/beta-hydrolase domain [Xenorhabdus nematophila ATCC 19061]|uniref:Esterase FrsA n=1 Tax=Xenorhabdus nematophila (strain ATCC 19061 / DSM 3370 / CCUG 14189 / LMG 1036 / NCIMB 9965 / AN6) TaxID=406817 RepID=D3V9T6_XENNA|nr:esterase FrsA [Xenorhabdus nematophila]CBJ89324.1 putative hydrolase with alpha/beta-hydrolase domain [Xenorhabdus nematophila ATCC 19061]CEK22224.1 putative hydrolase with alpha/beta-hydrolase domain [Xenorhabdus nematophila AN6/1]